MPASQTDADGQVHVDRQWLRGLPKCELHLHLEGTIQPATLVALSERHDAVPLSLETARTLYQYDDFLGFLRAFGQVTQRLQTPEDYELIAYEMIVRLATQGIVHAEVYVSFGSILKNRKHLTLEAVTEAIERGRTRAETECGTTIYWIIDAVRQYGVEDVAIVFARSAELRQIYPSIVGVGIGGNENMGPAADFRELYGIAKAAGLRLTAHAGESEPPSSIWDAIEIGAERLGHALSAIQDEKLMETLAERRIALELNVTSNLRTGVLQSIDQHPVKIYFKRGLLVTLNSDDPPMFGADLLDDYETVQKVFGFTNDDMRQFAANSIQASFLPAQRKTELQQTLRDYP